MDQPSKFRKKPVVIEAWKLTADNLDAVAEWCGGVVVPVRVGDQLFGHVVRIETLEGDMRAAPNEYIIKGVAGEFYPCKPAIFHETYERTDDLTPAEQNFKDKEKWA